MRIPSINDHPLRRVRVPQLNGGVNKTDHPSYINDNQLTDCNNMYFSGGRLRTRPGMVGTGFALLDSYKHMMTKGDSLYYLHEEGIARLCYDGDEVKLHSVESSINNGFIVQIERSTETVMVIDDADENYPIHMFQLNEETSEGKITPGYIPTVKINVDASSPHATPNGYMYQGYNLLSKDYKIACNTEGEWAWVLPTVDTNIKEIAIEYYDSLCGVRTANINVAGGKTSSDVVKVTVLNTDEELKEKNAVFEYWRDYNAVVVKVEKDEGDGDAYFASDTPIVTSQKNGLIITVIADETNKDNVNKITSMSIARWFGGARGGLENGTRLFVAGGVEPGIIRWSDLNQPDYFSENNYAYVGDGSEITALAQQDEMLVIFQENAITYATYMQGAEYTAEDIMNDRVVDVTTLTAQFPLTTIHSEIGCDCPDTVRLCNNRLVWLTSNGKVYCLVNNNQYNERNVREISYAIEKLLKQHTKDELKNAKSADVDGKYLLFVGKKIYVLDYANTSFEYYTSNAHEKKLKNYLSWYVWTLPDFVESVIATENVGDRLCIIANTEVASGQVLEINFNDIKLEDCIGSGDNVYLSIPCSFRTKLFAFSGDERMKRIPNCNIALCKIPGEVEVSFVTDNGSGTPRYISIDEEVSEDNPDSVKRMTLYPNANSTCLFGVEMKSETAMAVEGISISYKEMRDRQ